MRTSFKAKTAFLTTVLVAVVCAVFVGSALVTGKNAAESKLRRSIVRAVERNADEIKYINGVLEIDDDFALYSDDVYCDVYNDKFERIYGETPFSPNSSADFIDGSVRKQRGENGYYYVYDARLKFTKRKYDVDVFSGKIVKYAFEAASAEDAEPGEYESTYFEGGINTERAVKIALEHAGVSRENSTVLRVELPSGEAIQVFRVIFLGLEQPCGDVWIRGAVPASSAENAFAAVGRSVIYTIPIFLLVAAFGSYILAKKTVSPIERIGASARKISSGADLSKRIETERSPKEIAALARTFNEMLARLQKSFENEKRFASDASHELRTPLSVIKAEAEFALSKDADENDVREALEVIDDQADKTARLVSALLSFVKVERLSDAARFERADLGKLVETVCRSFVPEKGATVKCEAETNIYLDFDSSLITRALENLLSNAVRYGKENGKILTTLKKVGNEVRLSVADDGTGVKEENLPKIWDRFYREDPSRSDGKGFGLGLALVKEIAELHGGKVRAESVYGEGSKFTIIFFVEK